MSVYVITGVSKGIGFEFVKQISSDKENLVIGLVRDKVATEKKVEAELGSLPNVHILHADLTKYATIKQAASDTAKIVGDRGVDYLVANGAYVPLFDQYDTISILAEKVEELEAVCSTLNQTNVVGNVHLFQLFLPLVFKGKAKKVIAISTGLADLDLTNNLEISTTAFYAASKAALNTIVGKYNAEYKKQGVLFMSISPGVVEVGRNADATPEQMQGFMSLAGKLVGYAPNFKGPITPEESVKAVRSVWEKASIDGGYGGAFISHLGSKQWV